MILDLNFIQIFFMAIALCAMGFGAIFLLAKVPAKQDSQVSLTAEELRYFLDPRSGAMDSAAKKRGQMPEQKPQPDLKQRVVFHRSQPSSRPNARGHVIEVAFRHLESPVGFLKASGESSDESTER